MAKIHILDKIVPWCLVGILFHETAKKSPVPHWKTTREETAAELQKCYEEDKYPTTEKKEEIASKLKLPYSAVYNWFKKERTEKLAASKSEFLIKSSFISMHHCIYMYIEVYMYLSVCTKYNNV